MGLLDKRQGTRDEKLYELRNQIVAISSKLYRRMEAQHTAIFNMIWHDDEITAQEVFDDYGSDSASLFLFSQNIQTMLYQADPNYVPLAPPYPYTINPDGTVTVDYGDVSTSEGDIS